VFALTQKEPARVQRNIRNRLILNTRRKNCNLGNLPNETPEKEAMRKKESSKRPRRRDQCTNKTKKTPEYVKK